MKTDNNDITPGQDKFLRLHIDDLSQPIRRSPYAPPVNRKPNGSVVASLLLALAILATTAVLVHCSSH
jgi:hypothetical protein